MTALFALFGLLTALAQIEVNVKVADVNKHPLNVMTVHVEGSNKAICTLSNATYVFSCVSFDSREFAIANQSQIDVQSQ